jgi:hypothetical protein
MCTTHVLTAALTRAATWQALDGSKIADEYKYTHCNFALSSSQFPLLSQVVCILVF